MLYQLSYTPKADLNLRYRRQGESSITRIRNCANGQRAIADRSLSWLAGISVCKEVEPGNGCHCSYALV
jgi:hypothetical protein